MTHYSDPLEGVQARRHLEEINRFLLHGEGEIIDAPGKLSLVWTDALWNAQRFLSVKAAGDEILLINGRRYPASAEGLRAGLRAALVEIRRSG